MITTIDIDVISYCREILGRSTKIADENAEGRIEFECDLAEEELDDYYKSPFRKFKRGIDDVKKLISSKKKRLHGDKYSYNRRER